MALQNISNDELILRMQKLVRTERKVMHLVLLHIAEIESRKLYANLGFDGMYSYLTKGLGYSESAAYRRLQSARLLKQLPTVADKIEDGSLNLSQLTQVQKCLKESAKNGETFSIEQTLSVLTKLENKSSFETQKTLSLEMNLPVELHERVKPQQDESVRLEITLTKEQFAELEQAKSLLSHICPDGSLSNVIATLAKKFNQSKLMGRQPTHSAAATENRPVKREPPGREPTSTIDTSAHKSPTKARQYISVHAKRALLTKANNCCEYQNPKTRRKCGSKYKLEIDHRHPIALGGTNDIKNLRVLCQAHNALAARQMGLTT
ncbi:MAG: HNH endonuclease [Bdellovibrio sp.]